MSPALAYKLSDRANVGPFVFDTESDEWSRRWKLCEAGRIHMVSMAAAFEAVALLKLLADRGGPNTFSG